MKTVLGIDTSTLTASVAIVRGQPAEFRVLARGESSVNTHSQRLIGLIDEALEVASLTLSEVDGIAIGAGPGSFTGLRIGMATAKGLAFAADRPLWAVSSLAALALDVDQHVDRHQALDPRTLVVPVMDARRQEIFAGFYRVQGGVAEAVAREVVMAPEALADRVREVRAASGSERVVALGDGFDVYAGVLAGVAEVAAAAATTPPATAVARLVLGGEHADVLTSGAPTYIRLSEAEIKFPHGNPGGTFATRR